MEKKKKDTKWKPGQSGNPNGRPTVGNTITDLVKEYLRKEVPDNKDKLTYKDLFVKKILEKAYKGDMQALKLLWNYVDGMPLQKINQKTEHVNKSPMAEAMEKIINDSKQKTD